jgi:3-hydroxyisobutyrate dehydrogenase-like beta-hydroxyacid dehydrogenase
MERVQIRKVAIIGCGIMGTGIAQVCAEAGLDVTIVGRSEESLNCALTSIHESVSKAAKRKKVSDASTEEPSKAARRTAVIRRADGIKNRAKPDKSGDLVSLLGLSRCFWKTRQLTLPFPAVVVTSW